MIDYLTHPKYASYSPNLLPSQQGGAGGMSSKAFRVIEALNSNGYSNSKAITNAVDIVNKVVLVEPLRFLPFMKLSDDSESVDKMLKILTDYVENCDGKIILACSEYTITKLDRPVRQRLLQLAHKVTCNTRHQARVFSYFGIEPDAFLCDPVPDFYFDIFAANRNTETPSVVAYGNVSHPKNIRDLIQLYTSLEGSGIQRRYIGSDALWSGVPSKQRELQEELYSVCDFIIQEETPMKIANHLADSTVGVWVAIHDSSAIGVHEMLATGMPVVAAKHGLSAELPVITDALANPGHLELRIKQVLEDYDEYGTGGNNTIREWARANVSYPAFISQFQSILNSLWT